MHKTHLTSAVILALALGTGPVLATPRIAAKIDTRAEHTLTPAEQRAVSIAAGRLLRHTYNARTALKHKDSKQAAAEIAKARKLAAIIAKAEPVYHVKAKITAGELNYEDEDEVKDTLVPVFDELDEVSLLTPLHRAMAARRRAGRATGAPGAEIVANDELRDVQILFDVGLASDALDLAATRLAKNDTKGADQALASVSQGLYFVELDVTLPLERARDNLMLAKAAIDKGDNEEARAALAAAKRELDAYARKAGEDEKKAIAQLQKEMRTLSDELKKGKKDKGAGATIEGWWDRIGQWIKNR